MRELSPLTEHAVLTVLHRAGPIELHSEPPLVNFFDQAARSHPELFSGLHKHPQYGDSPLYDLLLTFSLGGVIRTELASHRFRASPRLLGDYGERVYNDLPPHQQKIIIKVANDLNRAFA